MPTLPQCDSYATIYATTGAPAAGVLVSIKRVEVELTAIWLSEKRTTTDTSGTFHIVLPQDATAYIYAPATGFDCLDGCPYKVPAAESGALIPLT